MRRLFIIVLVAVLLGGCQFSTPDTADSGTGIDATVYGPWNRKCNTPSAPAPEGANVRTIGR